MLIRTLKLLVIFLLLVSPGAYAVTLTFDDIGGSHGTVINSQYNSAMFGNVTISADNFNNDVDKAVVFNSGLSGTADSDLEAPFFPSQAELDQFIATGSTVGLNPFNPQNILIVQENSCNPGCLADDEGRRPAGVITFQFRSAIELISLDFFDIESGENGETPDNRIDIFDTDGNLVATDGPITSPNNEYHTPNTGGDNLWARVLFDTNDPELKNVGRIDVYFNGSGALDNLAYSVVPIPASVWLFGSALVGFIGYSRRRTI